MVHSGLQLVLLVILPQSLVADTTPRNLDALFKLACADARQTNSTCSQGWTAFEAAFAGKNWSNSMMADYDAYFRVFPIPLLIKDKALFWTDIQQPQESLALWANLSSSATLTSCVIVNTMQSKYNVTAWCGNANGGVDYTSTNCPPYQPNTPVYTFYAAFSVLFARNSAGTVFFLTGNTFRITSIFATLELPILLANDAVRKIVILNVFPNKTCDQAPLSGIKDIVTNSTRRKEYLCFDIPGTVSNVSQSLVDALTEVVLSQQSSSG